MTLAEALGDGPAAPFDLAAPVVYLPIRHHSPACAHHVGQVVRQLRPASVLVEGPRDATPLIPLLLDPRTRCPVALYTVYVDRGGAGLPRRNGAYYPLSDFSPELEALRAAQMVGAQARFIDLTYPEMVQAEGGGGDAIDVAEGPARSLQAEAYLRRSRFLHHACLRAGARDPDDLWDCLFEHDFRDKQPADFFREVLAWCALARRDHTEEQLLAEAHPAREAAMRHETDVAAAAAGGRPVVVITGGFHTVALPTTTARRPTPVALSRPDDANVTLMRYGFVQLDRLNGYASGMPSPEFYQRVWDGRDTGELVIEVARALRERGPGPSTADAIAALAQVRGLARFRGHRLATREDLLDGIRSCFVKGADDVEGIAVLAQARKQLAGERIGQVPPDAGRPPLVLDFERQLAIMRLSLEASRQHETSLDLYRSAPHRARSRFFHRLRLLDVPFAQVVSGPDYVTGRDLQRVHEVWRYGWRPATEAALVEQSRYGATVEEAASSIILEQFAAAEQGDGRSDHAAQLLLEACRCGLHARAPDLLARTAALMSADPSFASVARGVMELDLLRLSREPLEAHHLEDLPEAVRRGWERAAALVPRLAATGDSDETDALDQLCAWSTLAASLPDPELAAVQRRDSLVALLQAPAANPTLLGAAAGLLFDDGVLAGAELGRRLAGLLDGASGDASAGARFLRGVLRAARAACWLEPSLLDGLHVSLRELSDETFVSALPHLRLAFADLTPRECDRVAAAVAALAGQARLEVGPLPASEADLLAALRADRAVRERLVADGLAVPGGTGG